MMTSAVMLKQASAMMEVALNGLKVAQRQEQGALAVLQAGTQAGGAPLAPPAEGKDTVVDLLA